MKKFRKSVARFDHFRKPQKNRWRPSCESLEPRLPLTTLYVSPAGNDEGLGSSNDPWETLQFAADNVAPGDTVVVAPGQYAGFDLFTSGTENNRIVFAAEPGALINAPNRRTPDGINLEGASYVTIQGFDVTAVPRAGIRSVINEQVVVRNNRTYDNGRWGIFTGFSENILIEDNQTSGSRDEHGIYVSNSADGPIIRQNRVWGNNASGIQINADASQGGDGIVTDAVIERNIIFDNGEAGGSAINLDGVQDSLIQNNLLYDNHASGISLFRIDGAEGSKRNQVAFNTVIQPADGRWAMNIQGSSTHNRLINNIFLNAHSFRGSIDISANSRLGFHSDYNVLMHRFTLNQGNSVINLAAWQDETGQDDHSIIATADQLFVDWTSDDFRLSADSPARNAGIGQHEVEDDLNGNMRPFEEAFDIGASEYVPQLVGDFDSNQVVDAADIDRLYLEIRENTSDLSFDLDDNGTVDQNDANYLIETVLGTTFGDSNLDGVFDSKDIIAIFSSGEYQDELALNSTWSTGDWNGDGEFDSTDIIAALQTGAYSGG